jgi:hypothetical protein
MRLSRFAALALVAGACLAPSAPAAPAPAASDAPVVRKLIAPGSVVARQGHARFLVGVRTRTEARVIVRILNARTRKVVQTVKTPGRHAPGRAWLLVNATTPRGFQLPAGRYILEVYAVNAAKRPSNVLTKPFRLTLRAPRGTLQVFTVPAWPSLIAGVATAPGGQIVAATASGSPAAAAGLRVGDVIRIVNGRTVDQRGAWLAAMRELPAGAPIAIQFDRGGARQTVSVTLAPDWTVTPSHQRAIAQAITAAPTVTAYRYAAVRERLDAADTAGATAAWDRYWPAAARVSAPGEMLAGALSAARGDHLTAIGSFNRALVADPTIAAAQFGRGIAFTARQRNDLATDAFTRATAIDPTDGVAQTFRAFANLRTDTFDQALAAADAALGLDRRYEEVRIARGLALIGLGRKGEGVTELKLGLTLMSDPARAQTILTNNLEPNAP